MQSELEELVENQVGRRVAKFASFDSIDPEISFEVFVLDGSKPSSS
jgi:hypothetical protein